MGYIQQGLAYKYTPDAFGGSRKKALEKFIKAQKLMENGNQDLDSDWNYLNLLATIGITYEEMKDYKMAKEYYDLALRKESKFIWVSNELLPNILKKLK